jgi:hypothetical protein
MFRVRVSTRGNRAVPNTLSAGRARDKAAPGPPRRSSPREEARCRTGLKGAVIALVSVAVTLAVSPDAARTGRGTDAGHRGVCGPVDGKPNLNGIWQAVGSANWNLQDHQPERVRCSELGAIPGGSGGPERRSRERDSVSAVGGGQAEGELRELADQRPGGEVLPPGPATRDVYAVSVSDPADRQQRHPRWRTSTPAPVAVIKMGKVEPPPVDTWMGQSAGRWEGDTLGRRRHGP